MSSLRYQVLSALGTKMKVLRAGLPTVDILDQLPTSRSPIPSVVIRPGKFKTLYWQPRHLLDDAGDVLFPANGRPLTEVGTWEGECTIWCQHRTAPEREALEDLIVAAFNEEVAPGRLQVTVSNVTVDSVVTTYDVDVAFFMLPSVEWREELVFSERRWSFLPIETSIPILVLRTGEYKVTDMQLVFDEDIDADISGAADPDEALDIIEDEEQFSVDEDANLTPI